MVNKNHDCNQAMIKGREHASEGDWSKYDAICHTKLGFEERRIWVGFWQG